MESLVTVGIGGFFGAVARYALSLWVNGFFAPRWGSFPYGTLAVNVLGSFGLALFGAWLSARSGLPPQLRLLLGSGFFGAFTTFSAFAKETAALLDDGAVGLFALNLLLNNLGCLLAVAVGLFVGNRLFVAG